MKKAIITLTALASLMAFTHTSHATVFVDGYFKSNGTYVAPHIRTSPNNSIYDNYSYWD